MLQFFIVGPLTKEELRIILIDGIKEFIRTINSCDNLRPFLKTYPFVPSEIDVGIRTVDKEKGLLFEPNIFFSISSKR